MTKQTVDEATLKCNVAVEEAGKVGESITKMIVDNALVICDVNVVPKGAVPIKTQIKSESGQILCGHAQSVVPAVHGL